MKKITNVKIYIASYFQNLNREQIAIFICIPIAVVALTICAIILLTLEKKPQRVLEDVVFVTEAATEKATYSPESPYSLEFESLNTGYCAISGIGNFNGNELKIPEKSPSGEVIVEIKAGAFKNCDTIESLQIPKTIERIGEGAFNGCTSLIYIDVDMDNESFTSISGVLFSKSRARLIFYPPKKAGEKYYLNPNVKSIDDYAFKDAKSLSVILYPKSTADFESISIGKGNDILHTLPITCNYTGGK